MATWFGDLVNGVQKISDYRSFCACKAALWQLCAGGLRACRFSIPGSPTRVQLPPFVWRRLSDSSFQLNGVTHMNRYMPITGHDCNIPSLLIDTQAPIDVLHDAAAYRIRAVTQLLESFSVADAPRHEPVLLQELTLVCSIMLRDGCDLMDVAGRQLQERLAI